MWNLIKTYVLHASATRIASSKRPNNPMQKASFLSFSRKCWQKRKYPIKKSANGFKKIPTRRFPSQNKLRIRPKEIYFTIVVIRFFAKYPIPLTEASNWTGTTSDKLGQHWKTLVNSKRNRTNSLLPKLICFNNTVVPRIPNRLYSAAP